MSTEQLVLSLGKNARAASRLLALASTLQKNQALFCMADALIQHSDEILRANQCDIHKAQQDSLTNAFVERLTLTPEAIKAMAEGVRQIASLSDPIGEIAGCCYRPSGIQVGRMRVPLGVIAIIYEARPNVTADAAALCLKSGNAVILRGGKSALHSNQAIANCLRQALVASQLPEHAIQVLGEMDHSVVTHLVQLTEYVDVVVIRGGRGLVETVCREAQVPVIKHLDGICHVYIDADANLKQAFDIALDAKTQRYSTCNTMETLLVHTAVAPTILPSLAQAYWDKKVELRGCEATRALLGESVMLADETDWATEYLAPILSIRIVSSIDAAIAHIHRYGSQHTDAIVTENYTHAQRFLREVDSASVMVNASTRLSDGFEYGLGAEIGISTDKTHARGPVGLEGLTSQKWIVLGCGQLRGK